jgi:hypothetical protein
MFKRLSRQEAAQRGTTLLVILISGLAGQFAAHGMNTVQWLGAALAVLGSVTLAVMVRVWPPEPARQQQRD